jgi:hypothetical protein
MLAAIDLGSNMAQLLIIDNLNQEFLFQEFTSLGAGLVQTSIISSDAINRTTIVMQEFQKILQKFNIPQRKSFFVQLKPVGRQEILLSYFFILQEMGFNPICITEEQEALWSSLGAILN